MRVEDEEQIFFLRSDTRMLEFIDIPVAQSLDDARAYIRKINKGIDENEWIMWAIALKEHDQKLIGTICFGTSQKKKTKLKLATSYIRIFGEKASCRKLQKR